LPTYFGLYYKYIGKPGIAENTCGPSYLEGEAGGSLKLRIQSQLGQHNEFKALYCKNIPSLIPSLLVSLHTNLRF
jgi:hypothetical protein